MKQVKQMRIFALLGLLFAFGLSAGTFTNLNFENARRPLQFLDQLNGQIVAASNAFPGWSVSLGGLLQTEVYYNSITLGAGSVDLFGTLPPRPDFFEQVISGRFSAGLQNGNGFASLSQTGTIPTDSLSLLVDLRRDALQIEPNGLSVNLNGLPAPMVHLSQTTTVAGLTYDTYGVNVAALAGLETELRFSAAPLTFVVTLDNIRFSPIALPIVPEPSTWALFGVGLGAVLWFGRRR